MRIRILLVEYMMILIVNIHALIPMILTDSGVCASFVNHNKEQNPCFFRIISSFNQTNFYNIKRKKLKE